MWNGKTYKQSVGFDGKMKRLHVELAENVLGRKIPQGVVVHHAEGGFVGALVICENKAYHNLLHARMNAFAATHDPKKRKCKRCKQYDTLNNLRVDGSSFVHNKCSALYLREWYKKKRELTNGQA